MERRSRVEEIVEDWMSELPSDVSGALEFENFDKPTDMVFFERYDDVDRSYLNDLEDKLTEEFDTTMVVGTTYLQ